MAELALQMSGIVKKYGGVSVLKNVDFSVKSGEIHALLGENGAGKTTLMNILGGVTPMDSGSVRLFDRMVNIHSPLDAQREGIAFIHQELNVINDLAVYENMFLGNELRNRFRRLDIARMCEETSKVFERMNVSIDPRAMMRDLDTSHKQIVEIAKSLLRSARLIIMDEPTTSLTQKEIDNVFAIMRNLTKTQGTTIIFISHKLGEVVEFCDSYTVLRNGEKVSDGSIVQEDGSKISQAEIARMMVGRDVLSEDVYQHRELGDVYYTVEDLCVGNDVKGVSFELRRGEILGITGLLGDGKDQLIRCLFGDLPKTSGHVYLDGQEVNIAHPAQGKKKGVGYLPPNRKENAIIKDLSVQGNLTIVNLEKCLQGIRISRRKERETVQRFKDRLSIKVHNFDHPITSLSGGNQQKVVLAKWLNADPQVMILANPTQGVDVGAKNEIYLEIMKLAQTGVGVIVTSGEAQEIIRTCDRALVMYHGELRGILNRDELTEENIMILATGGTLGEDKKER
ncbi:MAG TPA: sugar ABC transporter ATP-binding protein [Candidatus Pullichristensenella stercoripullorum]|nr:sugar ABC transporter ATP-binding protein [Candidatus Pullichristensenella stercoripullorum]